MEQQPIGVLVVDDSAVIRQMIFDGLCVAIGISTGGPPVLADLFEELCPPMPPIVVVQHMPAGFTKPFASRLDGLSRLSVKEAAQGDAYGPSVLGVIMTGMGRDGSDGCRAIRAAGGYVLGQDEATSDVYGMNKVAYVEGNVNRQFALDEAVQAIRKQLDRLQSARAPALWG